MDKEDNIKDASSLQEELEEAKIQIAENLAGWQRAQADYANFKKETESRQKDVIEFANAAFMAEVLPIYNHFKLALGHIPKEQMKLDWVVGLAHIKKQFQDFLRKYKIEEIKTIGEKFDHNFHEAVAYEEKEGYESDIVFAEVQPGYTLGDKILVPAQVKVAK
ncbi:MAG: nucleotide exchange factor GrpE [Candidatus Buchananbacteria bacterium]|nr:nucleotide exchange factor GrpE [Candidatus Buchananbacteria bacterium]